MKDLKDSIPKVAFESFKLESNWKDKASAMTLAASLNLDDFRDEEMDAKKLRESLKLKEKKQYFKVKTETDDDPVFDVNYIPQNYSRDPPEFVI